MAQQVVDHAAHEAQQDVGIGVGQDVVEVQVFLPLCQGLLRIGRMRSAESDASLQRREMRLGQMRHGTGREFGVFGLEEYLEAKSICGYFPG